MCASETESVLLRARIAELERGLTAACEERIRLRLALQDVRGLCRCGADKSRMMAAFMAIAARCDAALGEG
ncbi:MAG TPA: hypothetical protein VM529_09485 [Gemmata sp.]|nr:hypothetical protein [Gemmata sp.]